MHKGRTWLLGTTFAIVAATGWAQQDEAKLLDQAESEFRQADAKLEVTYAALQKIVTEEERETLTRIQEAWKTYAAKSAELTARISAPGPEFSSLLELYERRQLALEREAALRRMLEARQRFSSSGR